MVNLRMTNLVSLKSLCKSNADGQVGPYPEGATAENEVGEVRPLVCIDVTVQIDGGRTKIRGELKDAKKTPKKQTPTGS